jgi:DNA-binding MarR family transcriptional regulator
MKNSNKGEARNIKDRQPFCWQEKKALEKIRRLFENDTASALLTYLALTEIASDAKAETFQASASHIASKAGLARKTVIRRVGPLEERGLIAVKRTKLPGRKASASNTYTLLKVGT